MFRLNKDPLPEFDDLSEMEENSSHSSKMFRTVSGASRKNMTMVPGLGGRNTPGDFAHILSFADMQGIMAWQNNWANNQGWRQTQDYQASYAECTGHNTYHARVLNRPGS